MNLNELAAVIAEKEVGKKQVSIGQIKEIVKILSMEMYLNPELIAMMIKNGKRNHKKGLPRLPEMPSFLKGSDDVR